jgi:hypothetical protein
MRWFLSVYLNIGIYKASPRYRRLPPNPLTGNLGLVHLECCCWGAELPLSCPSCPLIPAVHQGNHLQAIGRPTRNGWGKCGFHEFVNY